MGKRNTRTDPSVCAEAARLCACFNFRKASRAITQHFDTTLSPSGLRSTQFVILIAIQAEDGPVLLPKLAKTLNVDRSTLTRNLQPLERAGLLKVAQSREGRASCASLTAKGRRMLTRTIPLWEDAQKRFVSQLGARRWHGMLKDLDVVVKAAHDA